MPATLQPVRSWVIRGTDDSAWWVYWIPNGHKSRGWLIIKQVRGIPRQITSCTMLAYTVPRWSFEASRTLNGSWTREWCTYQTFLITKDLSFSVVDWTWDYHPMREVSRENQTASLVLLVDRPLTALVGDGWNRSFGHLILSNCVVGEHPWTCWSLLLSPTIEPYRQLLAQDYAEWSQKCLCLK